jgi:predicted phage tail protein
MTASAGRRRRTRSDGARRIASERRIGGLIRWQAAPRRAGGARPDLWAAVAGAAVLLTLAVIAARTAGWLHWGNLLMLVPAGVLVMAFGAGLVAMLRRAVAWLAG